MVRRQIGWPQNLLPLAGLGAANELRVETESAIAGHMIGYARLTIADRCLPPGPRGAALADVTSPCRDLLGQHPAADSSGMRLLAPCAPPAPSASAGSLGRPGSGPPTGRKLHRWSIDVARAATMDHRCCFTGSPGTTGLRPETPNEADADDGTPETDHPATINVS